MENEIREALCFGEAFASMPNDLIDDIADMEFLFYKAKEDFDSATEEQIEHEEAYQYWNAWCGQKLTVEWVKSVRRKRRKL